MKQTFRWFGEDDIVQLSHIKQAGATGIVTALHHIPNGEVWKIEEINKVKKTIDSQGLQWSFVESIPVHENIKLRKGDYKLRIENYKKSLKNIAQCGIKNVCYNFMPVLDWTRTNLYWPLENNSTALRFDKVEMAIFEIYLMNRKEAINDYTDQILKKAEILYAQMSKSEIHRLENSILKGLPGTVDDLTMEVFKTMIAQYKGVTHDNLKANLSYFLNQIIPLAEKLGIKMAIHPDDPPIDLMGLPRIVTSEKDLEDLVGFVDSPSNGITFCTGSLGANPKNNLPKIFNKFADRIHFLHLRNVRREKDGSFYEDNHLEGSTDMYTVVEQIVKWEKDQAIELPMRPDHGHQMIDDLSKDYAYCGYTAIGRLKGLAELRGLELGIKRSL